VLRPIITDRDGQIIVGHGVWQAAKLAGITKIPTVCIDHLTADQIRAYMLADNKIAELSAWDTDILARELEHLLSVEGLPDISVTGFDAPEIDLILMRNEQKERRG
jgi:ParB-like chromosome segregation protein Spo0J